MFLTGALIAPIVLIDPFSALILLGTKPIASIGFGIPNGNSSIVDEVSNFTVTFIIFSTLESVITPCSIISSLNVNSCTIGMTAPSSSHLTVAL